MASTKTRGLGKGLEALFGDVEINTEQEDISEKKAPAKEHKETGDAVLFVDINDIKPNSSQPRQYFNEEKIDELAASIAAHGVIQPIALKETQGGFEIIAGERRWRAARKAGLKKVPGIVKELTKEQLMVVALIENIQREDLNPIEEAEAFQRMCDEFGFTQEDVSRNVGKSRPYITNSLRLLKLPKEIQDMVLAGKLTNGHARALINIETVEKQVSMAKKVVDGELTVRETEKLVQEVGTKGKRPSKKAKVKSIDILNVEEELKRILGTKVTLTHKGKGGKLEIGYFSRDELERLIDLLRSLGK